MCCGNQVFLVLVSRTGRSISGTTNQAQVEWEQSTLLGLTKVEVESSKSSAGRYPSLEHASSRWPVGRFDFEPRAFQSLC